MDEKTIEPTSGLACGVWMENRDFYRYRGKLPIVVECKVVIPGAERARMSYIALQGCVSCQLGRVTLGKRWMILPP